MITQKQRRRLIDNRLMADHLTRFILKWINNEDRPDHITHILTSLCELPRKEQSKYYIVNDELYVIDHRLEQYQKTAKHGWKKTDRIK